MYQSKICKHFVRQVRNENLAYCEVCQVSYEIWEITRQVPYSYHSPLLKLKKGDKPKEDKYYADIRRPRSEA